MKTKYGFTMLETQAEIINYIQEVSISRVINGIQVHHTWAPAYANFYKADGSTEDELTRQNSMKSYHINTNGWDDIAQQFTVFPNGKVVTGRDINETPIGIKGWNTNKICIEIYGNFDKDVDIMTDEQTKAVLTLYGELLKRLGLTPSSNTLRYHAWFTSGGTYLGDYSASSSGKTCPGSNFFGAGNTMAAFEASFLPAVKKYIEDGTITSGGSGSSGGSSGGSSSGGTTNTNNPVIDNIDTSTKLKISCKSSLPIRSSASTTGTILCSVPNGDTVDIIAKKGNGWMQVKYGDTEGYMCGIFKQPFKQFYVIVTCDSLNGRSGPGTDYPVIGGAVKNDALTILEVRKLSATSIWGRAKAGYWINLSKSYVSFHKYVGE